MTPKISDIALDTTAQIIKQNQIDYEPKISVIIPVYNTEEYLKESLDSVTSQTLKEIEIICIDDGSKDKSSEILLEYAQKDKRITIIKQPNLGPAQARNHGISIAKGEFIAFMDSDDMYPNNHTLEYMYTSAKKNKVLICGGSLIQLKHGIMITDASKFEEGYTFKKDGIIEYKDYQFDYGYWRFIYNRQFLKENQIYFPNYLRQEDPLFFIKAMWTAKSFYALAQPTYTYRASYKQITWTEQKSYDVVKALTDVLNYTKAHNLDKLHYINAQRLINTWFLRGFNQLIKKDENKILLEQMVASLNYNFINKWNPEFSLKSFYKVLSNIGKISVIIPIYNVEAYLPQCLDSIINQTLKNLEIICINDGSTDGSLKIAEKYAEKDKRIIIINQQNQGLPNARNSGLKIATGEYIMFIDSDDWIDTDYIEKMYFSAIENNADMVKSGYKHYFHDKVTDDLINKKINNRYTKKQLLQPYENNIVVWATLYEKDFLIKNNILYFDNDILKHEDILYTLKSTILANKIAPVIDTYYNYRRYSSVLSIFNYDESCILPIITSRALKFLNTHITPRKVYIASAQRLVWRMIEGYKKLVKYPQFTKDKFHYLKQMLTIFSKFRYKREIFENYNSLFKKLNKKYINQWLANQKNILIVEVNNCHGECLPGHIKYFQDMGYEVDVLINKAQQKENPLYMFNNICVTYQLPEHIIKKLNSVSAKEYDLCFLNSNTIYGYNALSILNLITPRTSLPKILYVEHDTNDICNISFTTTPIVLKKFNNSDTVFEVNPHYFGEFPYHEKNKITKFIVAGNIENKRKNHQLLISAVTRLVNKGINNFVITIIGKGDSLSIPENISSYFDIKGRLSYPDMYKEMSEADYFLTLLDPSNSEHNRYLKSGTSGSFQLIYGFNMPCLIAKKFARKHHFNSENSIIYSRNSQLASAMISAINTSDAEYQKMKNNLHLLSDNIYKNSLQNLYEAINHKIKHPALLKSFLLLPYYLPKTLILRKYLQNLAIKCIMGNLQTFRVDIKDVGSEKNFVTINAPNAQVLTSSCFSNTQSKVQLVEGNRLKQKITIKSIKDGNLHINFLGKDLGNKYIPHFPLWIDYKSIKINNKEILSAPISTRHEEPYQYEISVKKGQEITIEFKQQLHSYSKDELMGVILKLNHNSNYIRKNIKKIIKLILKKKK